MPMLGNRLLKRLAISYLLRVDYPTPQVAPVATPYTEGWGILNFIQVDGQFSMSGGKLVVPKQGTPVWGDLGWYGEKTGGGSFARVGGRAFVFNFNQPNTTDVPFLFSIHTSTTPGAASDLNSNAAMIFESGTIRVLDGLSYAVLPSWANTWQANIDEKTVMLVRPSSGVLHFRRLAGIWNLVFVGAVGNSNTLYPTFKNHGGLHTQDWVKGTDLTGVFATDYGLCVLNITSDGQSIGAEKLANANLATWASNDPTGWTVTSEAVNQTISETAANGSAGNGSARFQKTTGVSSVPVMSQPGIAILGKIYEFGVNITAYTSGTVFIDDGLSVVQRLWSTAGVKRDIAKWGGTNFRIIAFSVANADFVTDDPTLKEITIASAQQGQANGIIWHTYTQPVSPVAGDQTNVWFRMPSAGSEYTNGWVAQVVRRDANDAYDLKVSSYVAGTPTLQFTASGFNVSSDAIGIAMNGNNLDFYYRVGSTVAKIGSALNNSLQATSTYISVIHGSGFTFGSLREYPITSATIQTELERITA